MITAVLGVTAVLQLLTRNTAGGTVHVCDGDDAALQLAEINR